MIFAKTKCLQVIITEHKTSWHDSVKNRLAFNSVWLGFTLGYLFCVNKYLKGKEK